MTAEQIQIAAILLVTIGLFLWDRWRHDLVALGSLMACVLAGLVGSEGAFAGFGHPAVITVACVLVISKGLQDTGAVDVLADWVLPKGLGAIGSIAALTVLGAVLSAFMNNVGAMALLLPLALQTASRWELPAAKVLMPLSFGSILGGMTTLIGTPPNLIVSGFRNEAAGSEFGMFEFAPVGASVAIVGVLFIILLGWRLVPARKTQSASDFDTGAYLAEALVEEKGSAVGMTLKQADLALQEVDGQIVGLIRNDVRMHAPNPRRQVRAGDVLVIEAEPESLSRALTRLGLSIRKHVDADGKPAARSPENGDEDRSGDPLLLQEYAVMPDSPIVGRTSGGVQMRSAHGISLMALSRQGQRSIKRMKNLRFRPGDMLLLQGSPDALGDFANQYRLIPMALRDLNLPSPRKAVTAGATMVGAIAATALGLVSAPIAFALAVLVMAVTDIIPVRKLYDAIDWSVIVLLAALIPVAGAMATTGTADLLAKGLLEYLAQGSAVIALTIILVVTMTLSDFMNNAATAAVMCPIALSSAGQLQVNPDAFLMAVAVGASCAFLTPIGHQNNTLILGPGGLKFGDYWRMGLPMEILVVLVGVPMLLLVWPL